MKLNLIRYQFSPNATIGKLSIDGVFLCYTLERVADGKNIENQSAINEGTYEVVKRWSSHMKCDVLGLCGVPGRSDIEIHIANFPSQLLGCIAVGMQATRDSLIRSTVAFNDLMAKFQEPATITIESAYATPTPATESTA